MIRTAAAVLAAAVLAVAAAIAFSPAGATDIEVYKTPWCGCCDDWVEHLRDDGFTVRVHERGDLDPVKRDHGVPADLASCHTAVVDGYVVEGHVPAADIRRLLADRPAATGIAVPGMPVGSPGMEEGDRREPYRVILFGRNGRSVYARH